MNLDQTNTDRGNETTPGTGGLALTLPMILNIVHRGRYLVVAVTLVGLLMGVVYSIFAPRMYEATSQVRPGVVSYTGDGTPLREASLKDIVLWFRSDMFWPTLRELPDFAELKVAPVIDAEFVPVGVQFDRGGDVITLTTFNKDAARAVTTLAAAVAAFNQQAEQDTLRGAIALTRGGALVRQDKIRADLAFVAAAEARNFLEIAARERELTLVDARTERIDLEVQRLVKGRAWRERSIATTEAEVETVRGRLHEARDLLATAMERENGVMAGGDGRVGNNDAVTELLLQTASREQAGRVGDLLLTVNTLSATVYTHTLRADSLRDSMDAISLQMAGLELEKDVELTKARADIGQRIADLRIVAEHDLPFRRAQFESDIQAIQVQIDQLTPLERVGMISVSNKPVRPRKVRATGILTVLAFCGGLFLVFTREYYRRNRSEILADGRP